jgi:flagellin-like hook-associated protein FlgL
LTSEIVALEENLAGKERSLGRIDDLDIARAASSLAKAEIKMQAATSILAQANALFAQRNYIQELL